MVIPASGLSGQFALSLDEAISLFQLGCRCYEADIDGTFSLPDMIRRYLSDLNLKNDDQIVAEVIEGSLYCCTSAFPNRIYKILTTETAIDPILQAICDDGKLYFLLCYCGDAGEVFPGESGAYGDIGIRYFFRSHEGTRHNTPHVHVDYMHEGAASIAIESGQILAKKGRIPPKRLKGAVNRILDNVPELLEGWNDQTDGRKIDLNVYFGKTNLCLPQNG